MNAHNPLRGGASNAPYYIWIWPRVFMNTIRKVDFSKYLKGELFYNTLKLLYK